MNKRTQEIVFSKKTDNWITDPDFLLKLDNIFKFYHDPCPSRFYKHDIMDYNSKDGLVDNWIGNTFINPPYSTYDLWVEKTYYESICDTNLHNYYVMLLPVRTDTKIFQTIISKDSQLIVFLKGRQKFYRWSRKENKIIKALSAPFPSMLVIFSQFGITSEIVESLSKFGTVFGIDIKNKIQPNNLLTYFQLA